MKIDHKNEVRITMRAEGVGYHAASVMVRRFWDKEIGEMYEDGISTATLARIFEVSNRGGIYTRVRRYQHNKHREAILNGNATTN